MTHGSLHRRWREQWEGLVREVYDPVVHDANTPTGFLVTLGRWIDRIWTLAQDPEGIASYYGTAPVHRRRQVEYEWALQTLWCHAWDFFGRHVRVAFPLESDRAGLYQLFVNQQDVLRKEWKVGHGLTQRMLHERRRWIRRLWRRAHLAA
jgi:hypothetical protein